MLNRMQPGLCLAAALALLLGGASPGSATPYLQIGVTGMVGSDFVYEMTLYNDGGSEPLSGLNLLAAYTIFGLDDDSTITAPAGWDYFAPLPPSVDELNYFSLSSGDDVPIGGSLGGFSFLSATNPNTLDWDSLEADAIGGNSSTQIPLIVTPEPATGMLLAAALAVQAAVRRRVRAIP
jgi:hypothetical protein